MWLKECVRVGGGVGGREPAGADAGPGAGHGGRPRYLGEEVQGLVQVGVHARGRLVGDFDGVLQDALGDDVGLGAGGRLGAEEHAVVIVAADAVALQLLVQGAQPAGHQVDVLRPRPGLSARSLLPTPGP